MALVNYLFINLGDMATHLTWTEGTPQLAQVVADTLLTLGLDTEGDSTDETALNAVGRYILWVSVAASLAIQYDVKADRGDFKRSQMFKNVERLIRIHKGRALPYLPDGQAIMGAVTHTEDPYKETSLAEFG